MCDACSALSCQNAYVCLWYYTPHPNSFLWLSVLSIPYLTAPCLFYYTVLHLMLSWCSTSHLHFITCRYTPAIEAFERAIAINPVLGRGALRRHLQQCLDANASIHRRMHSQAVLNASYVATETQAWFNGHAVYGVYYTGATGAVGWNQAVYNKGKRKEFKRLSDSPLHYTYRRARCVKRSRVDLCTNKSKCTRAGKFKSKEHYVFKLLRA